ncbi:MAG: hypothetical protein OEW75_15035 [Cyclobacteriaceae bacterium]|nr:hypothetical protein [Cyclobacteriaceae bacterium]
MIIFKYELNIIGVVIEDYRKDKIDFITDILFVNFIKDKYNARSSQ